LYFLSFEAAATLCNADATLLAAVRSSCLAMRLVAAQEDALSSTCAVGNDARQIIRPVCDACRGGQATSCGAVRGIVGKRSADGCSTAYGLVCYNQDISTHHH
jgi:hypothetical protein